MGEANLPATMDACGRQRTPATVFKTVAAAHAFDANADANPGELWWTVTNLADPQMLNFVIR
jgi:hypothetical protein